MGLARALADRHEVVVAARDGEGSRDGIELRRFAPDSAAKLLDGAGAVIATAWPPRLLPLLRRRDVRLVADLYDPVVLERLEVARHLPRSSRVERELADARALVGLQLDAADFAVCGSERQRDLLLGMLSQRGRLRPELYGGDPSLRGFLDVVPFGIPDEPPRDQPGRLRSLLPGGDDAVVALWNGSLWRWLDPLTAIRAAQLAGERDARFRLVFLAGRPPGGETAALDAQDEARALAVELGVLGRSVHFVEEWIPYEERAAALLDADMVVSLSGDHLENRFAVRSRLLDALWCNRPAVVTRGDELGERLASCGLARRVDAGDVPGVAAAFARIADQDPPPEEACEGLRAELGWSSVVAPIAGYLDAPRSRPQAPGLSRRIAAYYAGRAAAIVTRRAPR